MVVEPSEDGTGHFSGWNVAMAKASCLVVAGTDEAMERPCVVPMTRWQFERPNEYGRDSRSS